MNKLSTNMTNSKDMAGTSLMPTPHTVTPISRLHEENKTSNTGTTIRDESSTNKMSDDVPLKESRLYLLRVEGAPLCALFYVLGIAFLAVFLSLMLIGAASSFQTSNIGVAANSFTWNQLKGYVEQMNKDECTF
ncbi:unnamed protein product, partial [Mesorhabditis belari]|uniref:Uncharacterized protein n=1 Tax=Mesorhabditis belari TaxID=2138241 RepID=A0AAF3FFG1_9BILA